MRVCCYVTIFTGFWCNSV